MEKRIKQDILCITNTKMPFNKKTPTVVNGYDKEIDISNYKIERLFIYVTYGDDVYKVVKIDNNKLKDGLNIKDYLLGSTKKKPTVK